MIPAKYDIEIWRGSTKDIEFRLPLNLTGYTANIYYKVDGVLTAIPMVLSSYSADPVWAATVTLSRAFTRTLNKRVSYEFQITSAGGRDDIYLYGDFIVSGGVNAD